MKARFLKIIRKNFTIINYWDDTLKESIVMCRNNKTKYVSYHQGRHKFKCLYESICWQLWNTFDYKQMWVRRFNSRFQRELNKKFDTKLHQPKVN